MSNQINRLYEFGEFRINVSQRQLERQGKEISLQPKVFDLLLALVERRGQVVSKDQLMAEVWPDTFVEETNLKVNISTLRKVLGADGEDGKFIETLHKRGYRFTAEVAEILASNYLPGTIELEPDAELIIEKHSVSQVVIEETDQAKIQQPILAAPVPLLEPVPVAKARIPVWRILTISALLVAMFALSWGAWARWSGSNPQIESLAVLPFSMLGHGTDDEHLGLGLTDALITRLTNSGSIVVRPTSAVQKFTATDRNPVELGKLLKVDAVLDGNLQRSGEQVRLTVQLLNTADGKPLWAESVEETNGNGFVLQRAISEKLAHSLTLKFTAAQQQKLKKDYTANAAAFEAYTHGRYFYGKQNKEGFEKALGYFRQAINLDPNYALAWTGIADCYISQSTTLTSLGVTPHSQLFVEARAAAERAIALDESLADPHVSLAAVLVEEEGEAPHRELNRAIELNPNLAHAYNVYGLILTGEGRFAEALAKIDRAKELDPLSLMIGTNRGGILLRSRRHDEAAAQYRKTLEMEPNFIRARYGLGIVLGLQKRYDESVAELQKAIELSKGGSVPLSALGYVYAVTGRRAEAEQILTKLLALDEDLVPPLYVALVYAGLGDKERVFAWLEKIKGKHMMRLVPIDERFDSIRDDTRLAALMPK